MSDAAGPAIGPGDMLGGVSEAVRVVARLIPLLDRQAVADFQLLLGDRLGRGSAKLTRETNLGLVRTLAAAGEFPSVASYEAAVAREAAAGKPWPSAAELAAAYGGFHRAVELGTRYSVRQRGVRTQPNPVKPHRAFTAAEIELAIERCRTELGLADWPGPTIFFEWGALSRKIARVHGRGRDPRCPSVTAVRRCFSGYAAACESAARRERLRRAPTATSPTKRASTFGTSAPSRSRRRRRTGVLLPN